jgi:VanZ family protein
MLKYRKLWITVGFSLVLLVVYLSLTRNPPAPLTFDHADKLEHALAYATLSFWFCQIYPSARLGVVVSTALIWLGVVLEYMQGWTGYRTFDVLDMAADGIGVLLGWLLTCTPLGRMLVFIECRMARD